MSTAILPGSYDPITLGHLDIIKRATALYDNVIVAVMNNDAKTYLLDMGHRALLASLAIEGLSGVSVVSDDGMLVDLFDRVGADVILKGIRNERDRAYEEKMAAYNLAKNPRAVTVFMQAADGFEDISSTEARRLIREGRDLREILPPPVIEYFKEGYSNAGEGNA